MSLMHDWSPFVFIATNMALLILPFSVAVSHTGCPACKIGVALVCPIADRATFSILSSAGFPDRTLCITSRATCLSACHMHSQSVSCLYKRRTIIVKKKGYLVSCVQHCSQPLSKRFSEWLVLDTSLDISAQSKKIMCLNYACG